MDPIYSLKNLFRTSLRGNDFLLHGPDVWSSCIAIFTALIHPYSVTMLLNRNLFVLHRSVTCLSLLKALSGNRRLKDKSPITAQGSEAVLLWCASPTFFALTPFFAPAECQDVIRVEIPGYSAISDWPPSQAMVKNCWMTEGGGGVATEGLDLAFVYPFLRFSFISVFTLHRGSWRDVSLERKIRRTCLRLVFPNDRKNETFRSLRPFMMVWWLPICWVFVFKKKTWELVTWSAFLPDAVVWLGSVD